MKDRKWIIDAIIVIIVSVLFILLYRGNEREDASLASSLSKSFHIYLITIDKQDQFWYSLNQGAVDMAEQLGVTYIWVAPDFKDTQKQIDLLNQAVEAGADAILIAANDPVQTSGPIEDAKAKGVKIIYVDTPAHEEAITTLSTDNQLAGIAAGKAMISELEALGINTGRIGIVSVNTITDSSMKRELGFRDTIEKDGRFILLETQYKLGDPAASQMAAEQFINDYDDLVGIFATNEGSSVGVGNAINDKKKSIIGIGFDKSPTILDLLRNGGLKATFAQNPFTMGYLGMAEAFAALKGYDTGPTSIDTGVSIITAR